MKKTTTGTVQTVKAEAIEHKTVAGKILLYLKLSNDKGEEYFVNVGKKTYEECLKLSGHGDTGIT